MPLVEFVGGPLDGKREDHPRLDETITINLEDGQGQDRYIRSPRPSRDGLAAIYVHETHEEACRIEISKLANATRQQFPRLRVEYEIRPGEIRWKIEHEGQVHELSDSSWVLGSGKLQRPDISLAAQSLLESCRQVLGESLPPPEA